MPSCFLVRAPPHTCAGRAVPNAQCAAQTQQPGPLWPVSRTGDVFTLWRAQRWSDVTLDSLALLRLLRPAPGGYHACGKASKQPAVRHPDLAISSLQLQDVVCTPLPPDADLLVLGTGRRAKQLAPELARQLHEMGVRVDAMDTVSSPMHMAVDSVEASRGPGLAPLLACLAKLHTEGRWRQGGAVEQPHSMKITNGFEPWARRLMRWRHLMSSTRRREAWWVRSSLKMLRTDGEQEESARGRRGLKCTACCVCNKW